MLPVGTNLSLKNIPWATIGLLLTNWLVFAAFRGTSYRTEIWIAQHFCVIPGDLVPWTLVTSMFFHANTVHLLGNSLYLWVFGAFVEDKLGWRAYLFLYLFTGMAAGLIHSAMAGLFDRGHLFVPSLGASGAISGVMGIYLYRCYYSKIRLLIILFLRPMRVEVPAPVVMVAWFLRDFVGGIDSIRGIESNVAFWAHVGGFLAGVGTSRYLRYEVQARREKLVFTVDTGIELYSGNGEAINAAERLLRETPMDPEMHLRLARAKSRIRRTRKGKDHYKKAIRLFLERNPDRAAEVFSEFWRKYLALMEAPVQLRLSLSLFQKGEVNLAAQTLRELVDCDAVHDPAIEWAHLELTRIYGRALDRADLARYVYERFLERFPESGLKEEMEKEVASVEETEGRGMPT
jgi:membrane associated rhomboid family serine protease